MRHSKKKNPNSEKSKLELEFLALWRLIGRQEWGEEYPEPLREHYFYEPYRRWRFDFAWPRQLVAVEVEGGIFTQGRHARGSGISEDAIKYNAAAFIGWAVIRLTGPQLREAPIPTLEQIARLIHRRTVDAPRAYPLNSYALLDRKPRNAASAKRGRVPIPCPAPLFDSPLDIRDDDPPPF
jgi:hypothetical protein